MTEFNKNALAELQPLPARSAVALFRALFEGSLEAALLTRPSGEFLAANATACAVFGADEAALTERSRSGGHRTLADADDPRLAQLLAARAAAGRAQGEVLLRRFDGTTFEAEVSSVLFLDESNLATSVLTVRDISGLRAAERAARDSEQRLNFALDAADIGDWDMDLRSNVARRSLRHDLCFGYQQAVAEWGYDTFLAHVHPADRERVDACYQAAMLGAGDYDVEFRVNWPDGSLHWLWSKGAFFFDEARRPVRVAGIQVDVTARRAAADALQRSEERLQLALKASSDGLWDLDLLTLEPYYSPSWLRMIGRDETPSPTDAAYWLNSCHPDDRERVQAAFRAALESSADTYELEFRLLHRQGHGVPVLSRGYILRAADGQALRVSGTNTDLRVRNSLQEAQQARLFAEAANQAKSELLARMSHELRTPLNAVLGFAQLMTAGAPESLSAGQRRYVTHIEQSGWHLLNMIDEILDLSRIDSGHAHLKPEVIVVADLLSDCTGMLQTAAAARSIHIECTIDPAVQALLGDRTRVRQIIINLLSNAIKYTQFGGHVAIAARLLGAATVELSVNDNGPGLSAAQQAQLFQPFNRLGQENGSTPGNGLGLVISKRLAELMQGDLSVRCAEHAGCSFMVQLPAADRARAGPQGDLRDGPAAPALALAGRVLYIEDKLANAELMRGILAGWPELVLEVQATAEHGLFAAVQRPPDLILLDLMLPDLPGLELLRRLKQNPITSGIPVVVVSASASAVSVAEAMAVGAVDYVAKPIRLTTLMKVLEQHLPLRDPWRRSSAGAARDRDRAGLAALDQPAGSSTPQA